MKIYSEVLLVDMNVNFKIELKRILNWIKWYEFTIDMLSYFQQHMHIKMLIIAIIAQINNQKSLCNGFLNQILKTIDWYQWNSFKRNDFS